MSDKKIEFLHSAISDAQELIRFIDTKTAGAVTILGAYTVAFFSKVDKIIKYSSDYSIWFWIFLFACIFCLALCILVTVRIIRPTNNPIENINFGGSPKPMVKYYLARNDYTKGSFYSFRNSKKFKLFERFDNFKQQLDSATDQDILDSLTLELFKVSFIRNIKNDRFNGLLWLLLITTFLFFTSYFFYSIETRQIIEYYKVPLYK